jgi:hypothetical protein
MSNVLYRIALSGFNFFSISCFTYQDGKLVVGNILAASNIVKTIVCILLNMSILLYKPLRDKTVIQKISNLEGFSLFSKVSVVIFLSILYLLSSCICILQYHRRHRINKFINLCIDKRLSVKYQKKFINDCMKKVTITLIVVSVTSTVQFIGVLKASPFMFVIIITTSYLFMVIYGLIIAIKFFESFIIHSLKDFSRTLEFYVNQKSMTIRKITSIHRDYQKIVDLMEEFNRHVGLQLTVLLVGFIVSMVINVIQCQDFG